MKRAKIHSLPRVYNRQAVSFVISAVIITSTTITLVLVASMYAYQVLEQQRAMAEFECVKESLLALNDALENVAWKLNAARSVRFTVDYGHLELIPDAAALTVTASVEDYTTPPYSDTTGFIRYCIQTKYLTFGEGYKSYILEEESLIIGDSSESYGRAFIEQGSGWVNITLNYRVLAARNLVANIMEDGQPKCVNYVDTQIVKLVMGDSSLYFGTFDLRVRCNSVETNSTHYDVNPSAENCTINAWLDSESDSASLQLEKPDKVVFSFIMTEIEVG